MFNFARQPRSSIARRATSRVRKVRQDYYDYLQFNNNLNQGISGSATVHTLNTQGCLSCESNK
jgi:hypothetical protein